MKDICNTALIAVTAVLQLSVAEEMHADGVRDLVGNITEVGTNYYSPVGLVVSRYSNGTRGLCTGSLTGAGILTAAHCLVNTDGSRATGANFYYGGLNGQRLVGTAAEVHPWYQDPRTEPEHAGVIHWQFDIALIKYDTLPLENRLNGTFVPNLADPNGLYALELPTRQPLENYFGDEILFVGFGNQGNGSIGELPAVSQDQQKHYGISRVDSDRGDGYLGFIFNAGEAVPGRGDSGGPVIDDSEFRVIMGQSRRVPTVVGVNSHAFAAANPDGTLRTVYGTRTNSVKVADHLSWIDHARRPVFFQNATTRSAAMDEISENISRFGGFNGAVVNISDLQTTSLNAAVDTPLFSDDIVNADGFLSQQLELSPTEYGDFNSDGNVDVSDYTLWRDGSGDMDIDVALDSNGDGVVDLVDYALWASNHGLTTHSGSHNVPEPSGPGCVLLLFVCGLPLLIPRRVPCYAVNLID